MFLDSDPGTLLLSYLKKIVLLDFVFRRLFFVLSTFMELFSILFTVESYNETPSLRLLSLNLDFGFFKLTLLYFFTYKRLSRLLAVESHLLVNINNTLNPMEKFDT